MSNPNTPALTARMVLATDHPLHRHFASWVEQRAKKNGGDNTLTVRKARKYLAAFPHYRRSVEKAA